jgi:hypothetical protein
MEEVTVQNLFLTKDDFFFNQDDNVWQAYLILDTRLTNDAFQQFKAQDNSWFFNPPGLNGDTRVIAGTNFPGINNQFSLSAITYRLNDQPTFTETYEYQVTYPIPN